MAFGKVTFFFEMGKFGWSETYWNNAADLTSLALRANLLVIPRIKVLPITGFLTYIRASLTDNFRDVIRIDEERKLQGLAGLGRIKDSEYPSVALMVDLFGHPKARGRLFIRPAPNSSGQNGDTKNVNPGIDAPLMALNQTLLNPANGWCVNTIDPALPEVKILQITTGAVLTTVETAAAHGFLAGDRVHLYFVKLNGKTIGGPHIVLAPTVTTFQLSVPFAPPAMWTFGAPAFVRKTNRALTPITATQFNRVVSRRAGRPFGLPSGRRSARV